MGGWLAGYFQSVEELNSGPLKTNPFSGREQDLNPWRPDYKSSVQPLGHVYEERRIGGTSLLVACVTGSLVGCWACSAKTSCKAARVTLVKFLHPDSWRLRRSFVRLRRLFGRTTSTKASRLGLSEGSTISAFFF